MSRNHEELNSKGAFIKAGIGSMNDVEAHCINRPYVMTVQAVHTALVSVFHDVDGWFNRPEEAMAYKPKSGGWSIREVLEHITLTNHFLMLIIGKGCKKCIQRAAKHPVPAEGESDLDLLATIGQRGSFRWIRPEHMEPSGTKSMKEVRALMHEQVQACLTALASIEGGVGAMYQVRMSVNNCGKMDMYQWLFFLAEHARRHLSQMQANADEWAEGSQISV